MYTMMLWSLELEVLAWLYSNILEILHNPLNGWHVEIPNSGSFDDYISMELPHTLYEWLKCTPNTKKSNTISSVSQSTRAVTCSSIFSLETAKFPILDVYTWPWNHHQSMQTMIHVIFHFIAIFHLEILSFHIWKCKPYPPNIINNHPYPCLWFSPYFIAILHLE